MIELITSPDIYIPLIAFFTLLVITIIVRNLVYKNKMVLPPCTDQGISHYQ